MGKTQTGAKNGQWKGGRSIASNGYVLVRVGREHHLADTRGYAYEHRLVAEKKLGRRLRPGEQVHHIDGDKRHNDQENIEVVPSRAHHRTLHRKKAKGLRAPEAENPDVKCACGCGAIFPKFDSYNRPRRFVSGHNTGGTRG